MTFRDFFRALWRNHPFPWQIALAEKVEKDGVWPSTLGLPTAAGKTSTIDLAIFALAMGWPSAARRIFFVVDRRIVVDEAGERARRIAQRLRNAEQESEKEPKKVLLEIRNKLIGLGGEEDCPVLTATLRGGQLRDDAWTRTPIQPTVCCSTVDQIGSRLLFRGYGCSPAARPVHAALIAYDSLLILDEVHLSNPFSETLDLIISTERRNPYIAWAQEGLPKPLKRIELSATPGKTTAFNHSKADVEHEVLGPRLTRPKLAALKKCSAKKLVSETIASAQQLAGDSPKVVGIIVNRVSTARMVYEEISKKTKSAEHLLLTGRVRPLDRDALWEMWKPKIEAKLERAAPEKTIFVVTTQCVEAGANIDFDALVSEAASLDALRQRFGRLNRLGNYQTARAVIIADEKEVETVGNSAKKPHPVYGSALALTWQWLDSQLGENGMVNFAHESISPAISAIDDLKPLLAPAKHAAILLPAHLDVLCQTQPEPLPSPDISVFLHGPDSDPPDVNIVWRELLDYVPIENEEAWLTAVSACPPSSLEMLSVPFSVANGWLAGETPDIGADVDGASSPREDESPSQSCLPVLRWRGDETSGLLDAHWKLRPGDTIVAPASRNGCDEFGWNPANPKSVADLSETVSVRAHGRPLVNLASRSHFPGVASLIPLLGAEERDYDAIKDVLIKILEIPSLPEAVKESVAFFAEQPRALEVLRISEDGPVLALFSNLRLKPKRVYPEQARPLLSDDQSNESNTTIELELHQAGVAGRTKTFAEMACLPQLLSDTLEASARFHDIGKADARFQIWLRGGNKVLAAGKPLLAKGEKLSSKARHTARAVSGYPKGTRHECMSVALLQANPSKEIDELSLHLIASHHGHARPLTPVAFDEQPIIVRYHHDGWLASTSSAHGLASIGSGVCERFWSLTRRYGWWGLTYFETIIRLADHRQSQSEQENTGL